MFKLSFYPYILKLEHVFRISRGARSSTPLMLTRIEFEGVTGFGEASMPPLYGESIDTATEFLSKVDFSGFKDPFAIDEIMQYVDGINTGNSAAKASVDIALHDLAGKLSEKPCYALLNLPVVSSLSTSRTISIDTLDIIRQRTLEAKEFKYLKVKLGTDQDRDIINTIREVSNQPLYIDANQAWEDKSQALDNISWLKEQGVVFIEQPMPVAMKDNMAWLKPISPLPIVGDESIQRLKDVEDAENYFHGINIKLVKSTGLNEGLKMAKLAKQKDLKIMLGCMSETSCLISASFQLSSFADWVDLDGNLGLTNNPYVGVETKEGDLINNDLPGIGLVNSDSAWERITASSIN